MLEVLEVDRLLNEVVCAVADGGDGFLHSTEGSHDDDGYTGIGFDGSGQDVHASAVGQLQVGEHGGESLACNGDEGLSGICGWKNGVAHSLKSGGEHLAELGFVFDEKDRVHSEAKTKSCR